MSDAAAIIVFEKRPRWTPELQRQFDADGDAIRIRSCRKTADIRSLLLGASRCIVVLDIEAGPAECLQFLGRASARAWFPPVVVIGSTRTADLEWPARELGAIEFTGGPVSGSELSCLCRRILQLPRLFATSAPP